MDLTYENDPVSLKSVLLVPVSSLPLKTPDAIHRFKVLAGARYTLGRPGRQEMVNSDANDGFNAGNQDIGREGWIKMSEARFETKRMNRKGLSDTLERLVEAANVGTSLCIP
jgi:small subunit ribosomal protein S35